MSKKIISLCAVFAMLCMLLVPVAGAAEIVSLSASFDDLELSNDGTAAGSTNYAAETGSMWMSWQEKQAISAVAAPKPDKKKPGSSLTQPGKADQALQLDIQSGSNSNSMFNTSFNANTDYYAMGKLEISFNLYMEKYAGASHAPIQVDIRKDKDTVSSLISFRSSGVVQAFSTEAKNGTNVATYEKGAWYLVRMEVDTQNRTYSMWIDGEAVGTPDMELVSTGSRFPGDPEATASNMVKELRFSVNNGKNSTGSTVYIDDLYMGESRSDVKAFTVSDLYFSDGANKVQTVLAGTQILHGKLDYLYSEKIQPQKVALAGALYDETGALKKVWKTEEMVAPAQTPGTQKGQLDLSMDLSDLTLTGKEIFRLFLWNGLDGMRPLPGSGIKASMYQGETVGEHPTIYLAGDSICVNYVNYNTTGDTEDRYKWYPQQGWGHCLPDFFASDVKVDNRAYGGISTKTFDTSGRWDKIMADIKPGDYVFISLGHNDQNSSAEDRYTTVEEYKANLSRFVDETRRAGANALFITPVTMMGSGNNASNFQNKLLERSSAMKEVALERQVTLLDVNGVTFEEFKTLGYTQACDAYFMSSGAIAKLMEEGKLTQEQVDNHPNSAFQTNKQDLTHLTEAGAHYIAGKIAQLLQESESPLKEKLGADEPDPDEPDPDEPDPEDPAVYQWRYRESFEQADAIGTPVSSYKISAANTQTGAGNTAMRAEIAQAPGEGHGNALKVVVNQTDSSGYPYLDIALSEPIQEEIFVVDYEMWCEEKGTAHRKVGYRDENAAATVLLLNYRATGKIQNGSNQEIGAFPAGENESRWARYQMLVDLNGGTYTIYMDGTKLGEGTVKAPGRLKALRLTFENPKGDPEKPSVTYFDNIKVYTGEKFMPPEQDVDRTLSGRVVYNRYPQGKNKAVTFSFDDGKAEDVQTLEKLDKYQLKGTFNLVPKWFGDKGFVTEDQVKTIYGQHEIANHGGTHSRIETQTKASFQQDYVNGREALSALTGYDVRGYVYPFGGITDTVEEPKITMAEVLSALKSKGAAYGRTTKEVNHFNLPSDFLQWDTQIRIGLSRKTEDAMEKIDTFVQQEEQEKPQILMIWGHSHEIGEYTLNGQSETGWELFDQMCAAVAGKEDIWYATNLEIVDYQAAVKGLVISEAEKSISNPSDQSVWIQADGAAVEIPAGETYTLIAA